MLSHSITVAVLVVAESLLLVPYANASTPKSTTSAPNIVVNGSFEQGLPFQGEFRDLNAPDISIYGWGVASGSIGITQLPWVAQSGYRFVELNGYKPGSIAQTLVTEPGATYRLKFWLAGNPEGGPSVKPLYVRAAGATAAWSFNCTGRTTRSLGWNEITWKFTAKESQTVLEFGTMVNTDCFGPLIDNVSVVKIGGGTKQAATSTTAQEKTPTDAPAAPTPTRPPGANLIVNGSFEKSPNFQGDYQDFQAGSGSIFGWSVTSGTIGISQQPNWRTIYGTKCVELNGDSPGSIAQTIPTEPGAVYRVKFSLAGNVEGPPAIKKMFLKAGEHSASWTFDCSSHSKDNLGWTEPTWKFTAKDTKTTIEFGSRMPGACGALIDHVSVEKIQDADEAKARAAQQAVPAASAPTIVPEAEMDEDDEEEEASSSDPAATGVSTETPPPADTTPGAPQPSDGATTSGSTTPVQTGESAGTSQKAPGDEATQTNAPAATQPASN